MSGHTESLNPPAKRQNKRVFVGKMFEEDKKQTQLMARRENGRWWLCREIEDRLQSQNGMANAQGVA